MPAASEPGGHARGCRRPAVPDGPTRPAAHGCGDLTTADGSAAEAQPALVAGENGAKGPAESGRAARPPPAATGRPPQPAAPRLPPAAPARPPQPLPLPPPQPLPGGGVERTASTVSSVVFPEYCSPTSVSSISSFQNSERSHSSTRATSASIPASAPDLRQAPSPSGTASLLGMAARGEARVGGGRSGTERSAVSHVMAAPPPFCRCHSPQTWEGFGPAQGGRRGGEEGGSRGWAGGRGGVCGVV